MRPVRTVVMVLVAAAALGSASLAQAGTLGEPCTTAPESQWLAIEALKAKVEAQGFQVQKAKIKAACGEMYARDKANARVELFVDPTNGAIVGRQ